MMETSAFFSALFLTSILGFIATKGTLVQATEIRLINGTHPAEGRLEISINGVWGTLCDDSFDVYDALVACSMLGYTGVTPQVREAAYFGRGTGPIYLDGIGCRGTETDLLLCPHSPVGVHNCDHNEDVGIFCRSAPTTSRVRLVNGIQVSDGRLEIYINGGWGTICDDSFDTRAATVACRMLGYRGITPKVRDSGFYGPGTGQIFLDDVACTGNEADLLACRHSRIGVHNCGHSEDVGIICRHDTTAAPTTSRVRLVSGTQVSNGRLEIYINGGWGTICDDSFDVRAATVACRMLGYRGVTPEVRGSAFYGPGTGQILLDDLVCSGSETDLLACQHPPTGVHDCGHSEDVGIICRPAAPQRSPLVRLANGNRFSEVRVEIYKNATCGTVCDDHFRIQGHWLMQ